MNPVTDWLTVLSTLASVAVAVIGFAGLLTAFSAANAPLSRRDMVNIRILLIFSLGALVFALMPLPFADAGPQKVWPPLTAILGVFLLYWPIGSPIWNRRRGVKPQRPILYWGVLSAQALVGLLLVINVVSGEADGSTYAFGILWCLLVSLITFVAHVLSLLPVDRDQDDRR